MNLNMNRNNRIYNGSHLEAIILILIGFGIGIFFVYAIFALTGTIDKVDKIYTTLEEWELTK